MKTIRGELMLFIAVVLNSMGVVFILYSGSGISAISSVPYSLNLIIPSLSLGTWTYIFQALLIILLFLFRRRIVLSYLLSFFVGFVFGICTDIHTWWIYKLPLSFMLRFIYFIAGYAVIAFGIAVSNRCQMPLIPTDLFPREMADILKMPYSRVKVSFDVLCLFITVLLTLVFTGRIQGLGAGTVIAAFTTGFAVDRTGKWIDKRWRFVSVFSSSHPDSRSLQFQR